MQLETSITLADIRRARWAWYFRSTFGRAVMVVMVLFALFGVVQLVVGDVAGARSSLIFAGMLVLFSVVIGFAGLRSPAIKRMTEAPLRYEFSEEGVMVRMTGGEARFHWSEISRAFETSDQFVLMALGLLQVIPKRELDRAVVSALRAELATRLGARARMQAD